jgi:hypothetical protein
MKPYRFVLYFLSAGILLASPFALSQHRPVTIPHVRSGHAELRQRGRLTILELASPNNPLQQIPLSHPSDYLQGTNAPFEARLIAESLHHFLIFTDTFVSNANVQGMCGASETGERFVHVIALGDFPHETLSILVDSCLLHIEPTASSPEWSAKRDSAGFVGQLTLSFEPDAQPTSVYYVSPDGAVTRPEVKVNP